MASLRQFACALSILCLPAAADPFLGGKASSVNSDSDLLLGELTEVLGERHRAVVEERVVRLTLALLPTFQALPRTPEDRLKPAAVRYLLHRYFVDRHGWYVRGLDTGGEAWNSSTPSNMLGEHVGSAARNIFEERLRTRGLSLHEVAAFAATLEGLVHTETLERLSAAFRLAGIGRTAEEEERVTEEDILSAMDMYMLMHVLGLNHVTATTEDVSSKMLTINDVYPDWVKMQQWVRTVRSEILTLSSMSATSFHATARALEEVGHRYGPWQNKACLHIKDMLLKLEHASAGRVPLESFYGAALTGTWQLSESKAYLRQMGALDERDVLHPSVVIPNYVNAPSNCVASSAFYSVCCISECEALLGRLEQQLSAPDALPSRIVEVVQGMPSATVEAPRTLPISLRMRLEDIALRHGGLVPLHGRLFMQWLHHAFPNECSFPHLSGSSKPVTQEVWYDQTGKNPIATPEEMHSVIKEIKESSHTARGKRVPELPWVSEEELFVGRAPADVTMALEDVAQGLIAVATVVACSMAVTLVRSVMKAGAAVKAPPRTKLHA